MINVLFITKAMLINYTRSLLIKLFGPSGFIFGQRWSEHCFKQIDPNVTLYYGTNTMCACFSHHVFLFVAAGDVAPGRCEAQGESCRFCDSLHVLAAADHL